MTTVLPQLLPLIPGWPLMLAILLGLGVWRPMVLSLVPWAALPALLALMLPDTELKLSTVMLGGTLVLDSVGRVFLLLVSVLWLATGWLAQARLKSEESNALPVWLLLTMAGDLGLVLAGDALSFYSASILAGYALYGLMTHGADHVMREAGRRLLILLVVSDLLLFELLLMLGEKTTSLDFPALRQAFLENEHQGLALVFLVFGFGVKFGLLGTHFWLPPLLTASGAALRPALVAFLLTAGLLGAVRLLPHGAVPGSVEILQWYAWITLFYALIAGLCQPRFHIRLAYAAIALSGLWLAILVAAWRQPALWRSESLAVTLIQAGFALSALSLLVKGENSRFRGAGVFTAQWLAALSLATCPLGIAVATGERAAAMAVFAYLAVSSLLGPVPREPSASSIRPHPPQSPSRAQLLMAAGLSAGAAGAGIYKLAGLPLAEIVLAGLSVTPAALLAVMSPRFFADRLPNRAVGRQRLSRGLQWPRSGWPAERLKSILGFAAALAKRFHPGRIGSSFSQALAREFQRWPTALLLMLLLGLLMAGLGRGV